MFKNHPVSSFLYSVSYRLATTFMGKVASKIIILDQGTKKWAIEQYGYSKNKITIIPHGMLKEAEYITAKQAKEALGITRNGMYFFFLVRFILEKELSTQSKLYLMYLRNIPIPYF